MPEPQRAVPLPPRGLSARRRPEPGAAAAVRQDTPPGSGRAPRLPAAPLPAGLLPLPAGFELTSEAAARSSRGLNRAG